MANLRVDNLCGVGFVSANDGTVWSNYITGGTLSGSYPATNGFDGNVANFVYAAVDGTMIWTPPNGGIKAGRIEVYVYAGNTHPIVRVNGVSTGAVVGSATPNQRGNWVDVTSLVGGHLKTITCYGQEIGGVDRQSGFAAVRINGEILTDSLVGTKGGRNAIDGSVFFDGLSYLTCATSSDFALPGDFTLEMWWKNTGFNGDSHYVFTTKVSNSTPTFTVFINGSTGSITVAGGSSGGSFVASSGLLTLVDGAWHHIAYTRSSGTNRVFVDGIVGATANSDSTTYTSQTNRPLIGSSNTQNSTHTAKGYISNLRLVKGTALYTANFTPPTEKLTAIDGTILLCCQDSDDSIQEATGKTITAYGNLDYSLRDQNLITNGNFDSSATDGWTVASGSASLGTGQSGTFGNGNHLVMTGGNMYQAFTTVIGRTYFVNAQSNGGDSSYISTSTSTGDAIITDIRSNPQTGSGVRGQKSFVATQTTYYVILAGGGTGNFDTVSVYEAKSHKPPKDLPPVGVDAGVVFDGDTKINSQGYMYFPTGDTSQRSRGFAVFGGGITPSITSIMDYCHIPTMGNLIRWGDLTASKNETSAFSSSTRGVWAGGTTGTYQNVIESMEFATQASPTNFGDLTIARGHSGGTSNSTRGLVFGGYDATPNPDTMYNRIDYVTIASKGDAINFGDASETGWPAGGARSSTTRAVTGGYATPSNTNTIDYVTIATLGDATNFGDLNHAGYGTGAGNVSNGTRAVFLGNSDGPSNTIDYITIATTGDATDFGDLTAARRGGGSASTLLRGILVGGRTPSEVNTIDYVTIATTGNGSDFGDATSQVSFNHAGCSDSHGGLS